MNSNSNNYREMYWDESNRLRVVNDNDHQIQHYIYDGAGERILKASSQIETVYENGQVESNNTTMGLYTTYVSPYMVVDANQKYSKHYFNGTQRVASKIGEQDITMFDTNNPYLKQANNKAAENTPSTDFDALKNKQITDFSYYLSKSTNNATAKNVKVNYTEYKKADTNTETTSAKEADNNSAFAAPQYAEIYYYHSDHLGTGTFLSDFEGNPYQFFLNLPFGETMAEQHSYSGEYTNRYKFNGKELDEETGFYYYGARYYNPKFSIWLSVDPLMEETMDSYGYCYQNPVVLVDPDGMKPDPPSKGWYRFWGGMRSIGGALQVTAGIGLLAAPEPTGLTKVGGVVAVAHGADDFQTGLRQLWTGEDTVSLTYKGIKNTSKALGASENTANNIATFSDIGLSFVGGGAGAFKVFSKGNKIAEFTVAQSKFDYFFGRVVTGTTHNIQRSAQNLKDLTTLGIKTEAQLTKVFGQTLSKGKEVSRVSNQYGTTITKSMNIGRNGQIQTSFFYEGGNLAIKPKVTTIIPKIFKNK